MPPSTMASPSQLHSPTSDSPENTKKRKGETTDEKKAPPPYGSQSYWEERYKKHKILIEKGLDASKAGLDGGGHDDDDDDENIVQDEDALPLHEWYFSYDELRPILLPLLLGGKDDEGLVHGDAEEETNDARKEEKDDNEQQIKNEADTHDHDVDDNEENENTEEDDGEDSNGEGGEIEIVEEEEDYDDEEEPERPGVCKDGPVSILEVGCGDVPLGTGLARDIQRLQKEETGSSSSRRLISEIVCCDYSPTVIEMLKKNISNQECEDTNNDNSSSDNNNDNNPLVLVDYVVADARELPYDENKFHLVLEKGTLDAMLSDKQNGVTNCIKIVTECARVLAIHGYILIVSHLNAHTEKGLAWLNDVVVPGINAGGKNKASWEIEVHGGGDESIPDDESASESAGPAVYIIRKMDPKPNQSNEDPPNVPIKFFSY